VPFYIRAGKSLPVTCTEVLGRLRKPPSVIREERLLQNYLRFRISPEPTIAIGATVMAPSEEPASRTAELVASRHPAAGEADAYERVLTDALNGDATLFARQDYVEEAWRIVDLVLKADTPVFEYEPQTWGPKEVERLTPPGGWHDPVLSG